jgi:hypothetical protein
MNNAPAKENWKFLYGTEASSTHVTARAWLVCSWACPRGFFYA